MHRYNNSVNDRYTVIRSASGEKRIYEKKKRNKQTGLPYY